jgi:arylsulfatase A
MCPVWTENSFDPQREVFTHYPVYHHAQPMSAVRKGDWKIVENLVSGEFELFNLRYDVSEMTDLKYSFPVKLEELRAALKKWQEDTKAQMPVPNPNYDPERRYDWGRHPYRK